MVKLPGIGHTDAVKAFKRAGFEVIRQNGHIIMSNSFRTIVVPRNSPINTFTMYGIVQDSGLTVRQFRELP